MPISFPLTIPDHKFTSTRWTPRSLTAMHRSPFTGQQQSYTWPAQWWEVQVSLPPMPETLADDWVVFLLSLNGQQGYFQMGDSVRRVSLSSSAITGEKCTTGVSAGASTMSVTTTTGAPVVGDWFSIASNRYLHKVLKVANVSAGVNTLDFFPNLRANVATNDALNFTNPLGYFRLAPQDMGWSVDVAKVYGVEFSAMEYLT